ncbi:MAG: hypothetical protein LLH30_06815 [Candidatus Manganitrophus sp. SA1]|nr:hypothetical protein [Candidatus Manganitrophus morganii]
MKKSRFIFLPLGLFILLLVPLFVVGPIYGSMTQKEERISLPLREHISPIMEHPFLPSLNEKSFSTHDEKAVEYPPVNIAKRFRMRRHSEREATDSGRGNQRNELGQTADPQVDTEDIPGIEYDEQGRPKEKRRRENRPNPNATQDNGNGKETPATHESILSPTN